MTGDPAWWRQAIESESAASIPKHRHVQRAILRAVASNALAPGERLPGELRLCELFEVSRTVVRQALSELEHEGTINRVHGKGTFIAMPKTSETLATRLAGLYEEATERGGKVTSRVLHLSEDAADSQLARILELEEGAPVTRLDRLRLVDDEPWSLSVTWMPSDVGRYIYGEDLQNQSLYALLAEHGIRPVSGARSLEALVVDRREGSLLGIGEGAPALKLSSVSSDAVGRPIETFTALHRADRSRFVFETPTASTSSGMQHFISP